MAKFDSKVDGNTVGGDEYNNIVNPLANLITSSGQTIDTSNTQVVKAIADYAAVGTFYSDGGVANAYSLSAIGSRLAPNAYSEGMEIRFRAGNANTGAATVNVAGLGVKSIKQGDGSTDLTAGDISTDFDTRARYDGTVFRLSNVSDVGNLSVNGKFNTTATSVTISSGAITYSSAYMVIDTEGGASSDNLDTINGGVDGDEVSIRPASGIRNITIRDNISGGNILLKKNLDVLLDESYDMVTLKYRASDGYWFEVSRSLTVDTRILQDLTVNGKFNTTPVTETISSGAITYSSAYMVLDTEGGASSDDLDTITGGTAGDRVVLKIASSARNVIIKDGTGNIQLYDNRDILLDSTADSIELIYDGASWLGIGRIDQDFASSDAINGYQYLPSGFIMQWGVVSVGNNATVTVTLPVTYTANHRGVYASIDSVDNHDEPVQAAILGSISQIQVRNSNVGTVSVRWLSIGF
jgi:hypothetical protein